MCHHIEVIAYGFFSIEHTGTEKAILCLIAEIKIGPFATLNNEIYKFNDIAIKILLIHFLGLLAQAIIPTSRKQTQEVHCKFEPSLVYIMNLSQEGLHNEILSQMSPPSKIQVVVE